MSLPRVPQRTTPGFAFSILNRALHDSLAKHRFTRTEIAQVLDFFEMSPDHVTCVYCGSGDVRRWDHVVPVMKGGETVLGNMVPACGHCDDSKQALSIRQWFSKLAERDDIRDPETRLRRIEDYARHFGYAARPLEERLNTEEWERLEKIRHRMDDLRQEVELLIQTYQNRTRT